MKKIICFILSLTLVMGMGSMVFADSGCQEVENSNVPKINTTESDGSSAEPFSSRWYNKNVVEVSNKAFTFYSSDKLRMVQGTYKKVATYKVYLDGSGKQVHLYDTYHYTWSGYYRKHTSGTGSNWIQHSSYRNITETYRDRGPAAILFNEFLG